MVQQLIRSHCGLCGDEIDRDSEFFLWAENQYHLECGQLFGR